MSMEIDCPDCENRIDTALVTLEDLRDAHCQEYTAEGFCDSKCSEEDCNFPSELPEDYSVCTNPDCKDGKITVYTEAELKQAVKEEREECALVCENMLFEKWEELNARTQCAEVIRARGNE